MKDNIKFNIKYYLSISILYLITMAPAFLLSCSDKDSHNNGKVTNYIDSARKLNSAFIIGDRFSGKEQLVDVYEIITTDGVVTREELKIFEKEIRKRLRYLDDVPFNVKGLEEEEEDDGF